MILEADVRVQLQGLTVQVSLRVEPGCPLAVVGPSGAGKTTLLRMLAGLLRPEAGRMALGGQPWFDAGQGLHLPTRRRNVGLIFQDAPLFPHLSVLRNVQYAAREPDKAEALLERFGIWHRRGAMPEDISGGERQRAAICQILASRPRLLLLDEPFAALDIATRLALRRDLLAHAAEERLPMVHVTHDLGEALAMQGDVLALVAGRRDNGWLRERLELLRLESAQNLERLQALPLSTFSGRCAPCSSSASCPSAGSFAALPAPLPQRP